MGLDQGEVRLGCLELFAQGGHVDAEGDDVGLHSASPDLVDDVGVGQDLPDIGAQEGQKPVFDRGQADFLSRERDLPGSVVDGEISIGKDRILLAARADVLHAPLGCPDAGEQLLDGERLSEIVIRPAVQSRDLVAVLTPCADDNDDGA